MGGIPWGCAAGGRCDSGYAGEDSQKRRREWREVRMPPVPALAGTGLALLLQTALCSLRAADIRQAFLLQCAL